MLKLPSNISLTKKIVSLVGLLFIFVGVSGYFAIVKSENSIIENQSLSVAEIITRQASAARSIYSKDIIGKVQNDGVGFADVDYHNKVGALPVPAQFSKHMAVKASEDSEGIYSYKSVSKWNLSPDQYLDSEFLQYAWTELEKQDQKNPKKAIDWEPIYKVQDYEGKQTLLYLRAEPAANVSCVNCHNNYEQRETIIERRESQGVAPRKVWKQHELLGAYFVKIPVDVMQNTASKNSKLTIFWIFSTLAIGLSGLGYFFSRDLIKARGIRELMFWQAKHDTLTKLPNRISFEEKAQELINDARENNSTHAMCFLDLDQFKLVNDTCGHAAGDDLLCEISNDLSSELVSPDMLARLGGDEFGVLLNNSTIIEANEIAQKLCDKAKKYQFTQSDIFFDIGVSIGLVAITKNIKSVDHLMSCADLACYAAKDAGRSRVQVYSDDDKALNLKHDEMTWVSGILRALKENRIVIYSQKISTVIPSSDYTHHEILVRLIDDDGDLVLPDEFLPAAERYQLMSKLDLAIVDRSFSALNNQYFKDLGDDGFISINLSGQSLSEPDFLNKIKKLMMKHRVNPSQICFEITESAAIESQGLVKKFMIELKRLDIKFALDDFGTGLSSLTYLKEFPVDYLKIDGSFIKDILTDPVDKTLVEAINNLAHSMGLKTVAEYVESKEIFNMLNEMNIDYAQGYHIQIPIKVDLDFSPK